MPSRPIPMSIPNTPADASPLVCVVDDDDAFRKSLERLLRAAGFAVETFASATGYLDRPAHAGPLCLVLDVNMPGLDGFELQRAIAGRREQIIFLTGHGDVPMCAKAMKAGAVDFLTKPVDCGILLPAVAAALQRAQEAGISNARQAAARKLLDSLTKRESEVLEQVLSGCLNKQIADKLGIAEKTVKIHRGSMMRKTRCTSVPDLMRLVQSTGRK